MKTLLMWILLCAVFHTASSAKISRVIVLMQENRSFDHLLGFYPGTFLNSFDKTFSTACFAG